MEPRCVRESEKQDLCRSIRLRVAERALLAQGAERKTVGGPKGRAAGRLLPVLTVFGASAVSFMMLMYALEKRHNGFVLAFACGCAFSSAYGFLAGTWPFGVVEAIWAVVAAHRFAKSPARPPL